MSSGPPRGPVGIGAQRTHTSMLTCWTLLFLWLFHLIRESLVFCQFPWTCGKLTYYLASRANHTAPHSSWWCLAMRMGRWQKHGFLEKNYLGSVGQLMGFKEGSWKFAANVLTKLYGQRNNKCFSGLLPINEEELGRS